MILAAILFAEGKCDPPPDLRYWLDFKRFGILPRAGGIDDQVYGQFDKMISIGHVHAIWVIRKYQGRRYRELTKEDWTLIIAIQKHRDELSSDDLTRIQTSFSRRIRR